MRIEFGQGFVNVEGNGFAQVVNVVNSVLGGFT